MKNISLILIGLVSTINLLAQTNRKVIQLAGTISDKDAISMTLAIENDTVLGFYYYEKYKTKILLEGQVTTNRIILNESPDFESEFKKGFIGEINDYNFTGKWLDKTKDKTLKCELDIKSNKQINLTKENTRIEGIYKGVLNSEKYIRHVSLKNITDELFCFEISSGTKSGCIGFLKGLIELKKIKKGVFSADSCDKLEFQLSNNELTITENNCDFHGMRCPFGGKYEKNE